MHRLTSTRTIFARCFAVALACGAAACGDRTIVAPDHRLRVGVLGNSDSHSYHDSLQLRDSNARGGGFRATTFQWTEVWSRLRPNEVNLGDWGVWGTSLRTARGIRLLGMESRGPRKLDYRFNMALSGARCVHLTETAARQAQPLVQLMDADSAGWANGIVVIRIGINSVGRTEDLDAYARNGPTPDARAKIDECVRYIESAIQLIRASHPTARIVVVGIADDSDWWENHDRWTTPSALTNIDAVLDLFDGRLRELAARDRNIAFLDERSWFRQQWGSRSRVDGHPAYRAVKLGGPDSIVNASGDHPRNLGVADGHAGTVANGLWLNALIDVINQRWQLTLHPLTPTEIARLADPSGDYGIRAK